MEGENDDFVKRELSAEAVASAEVSYMGFYRSGRGTGHPSARRPPRSPAAPASASSQAASLPKDHPLLRHADLRGDARGLVRDAERADAGRVAADPDLERRRARRGRPRSSAGCSTPPAIDRIADQYKLDLEHRAGDAR